MATLIAVYTSDGCVGRCDAKCYMATHESCDCICRGMNHGVGLQRAVEQTRDHARAWIDEFEKETGLEISAELFPKPVQMELLYDA